MVKKRWVIFLITILCVFFTVSNLKAWEIGVFVNDKNLDVNVQNIVFSYSGTPVYVGSELLYSKGGEDSTTSWLVKPYFLVTDFYKKPIDIGVGFQNYFGRIGNREDNKAGVITFGFLFEAKASLQKLFPGLPLMLLGHLSYSPEILCFDQAKRELGGDISLVWKLNNPAAVLITYKIIKINTTKRFEWNRYLLMLGVKVRF
ncbi:MAG: hypothetical protein GXO57_06225 [Thermodesulfobacteria bacterium]|nr:hypothetical protein [Thermodesulfobacteriota bacterium]